MWVYCCRVYLAQLGVIMKSLKKLGELADRFAVKLSLAQTAQSGDIEKVLRDAGVFPAPEAIAPLLNDAKVPDNVSLKIGIMVDSAFNVKFTVVPSPASPSGDALAKLLNVKFAPALSQALKKSQLGIEGSVAVPIATF